MGAHLVAAMVEISEKNSQAGFLRSDWAYTFTMATAEERLTVIPPMLVLFSLMKWWQNASQAMKEIVDCWLWAEPNLDS